jgi:hypothetical protein
MPRFFKPPHEREENEPSVTPDDFIPKILESGEIKTLLSWQAPSRPHRKKDRSYYTTVAIIAVLLALIAFVLKEFLLIGAILAFVFVTYVLAFVPPSEINYKISTQGITIGDHFYFWHDLLSFWFKNKEGQRILHIQTRLRFPAILMLVIKADDEERIKKIIARFLPFHEIPEATFLDKWAEGLQKHFPLENPHTIKNTDDGCRNC